MIIIEITNAKEIVRRERGLIASKIGPYLSDIDAEVEHSVISEIQAAFARRGIEARIVRMQGVELRYTVDNNHHRT